MTYQDTKEFIVKIIREEFASKGLEVKQIILFGSQSRGDAGPNSDWDFLVSISDELDFAKKAKLITAIQRQLAQKHISADVIIKSESKILKEKNNVGIITYYAFKDGILV